jgi:valyl-tRNA synthetase
MKNGAELFLPLEGVIDIAREADRLRGEIARIREQLRATERKLENEAFVSKAPTDVVARERDKADSLREQARKLQDKLRSLDPSEGAS